MSRGCGICTLLGGGGGIDRSTIDRPIIYSGLLLCGPNAEIARTYNNIVFVVGGSHESDQRQQGETHQLIDKSSRLHWDI